MIRGQMAAKGVGRNKTFRWRGGEITRFEGFTDAVFAFAVTLLVVSLEVPKTFTELLEAMRGFIAFAICFALLVSVWFEQYKFFRRYGLQDAYTIFLNAVLVFVVLFYVYPLKFLFSLLADLLLNRGHLAEVHLANGASEKVIEFEQFPLLMIIYGLGYVAVFVVFALLYYHALRKRQELELNELEILDTKESIQSFCINCFVGVLSVLIAYFGREQSAPFAGFTYILLGPLITIQRTITGRQRRRIEAALDEESPA